MSNPSRVLDNRLLPPLHANTSRVKYEDDEFYVKSKKNKAFNYISLANDSRSSESITLYLIKNPDFLESFLIHNYSYKKLVDILKKLPEDISNKYVFSRRLDNLYRESQMCMNPDTCLVSEHKHRSYFRDSINSTLNQSVIAHLEKKLGAKRETYIRLNSKEIFGEMYEEDINKQNRRFSSLSYLPAWSLKLLHSHKDFFNSDNLENSNKVYSMNEILEDISNGIFSVLQCDGSIIYFVDHANDIVYQNLETKPTSSNIIKGTTVAAHVAAELSGIISDEIFEDERFPGEKHLIPPSATAVMAEPIIMNNEELVGVIEVYRKAGQTSFSLEDEKIFKHYCIWGGIAVFYNEIYICNRKERKMNKFLLELTKKLFGKFQSIDCIIKDVMASAKWLVKADRVTLFLVDKKTNMLYSQIFDKGNYNESIFEITNNVIRIKIGEGIAGFVAATGKTLNILDAYQDKRFKRGIDLMTGYVTKTILTMPVKLNNEVLGVVQMLNKKDGSFTENDENDFESFATYCGVALNVAKIYKHIRRSEQKYKVALDILSYHSGHTEEEFRQLKSKFLPIKIDNIEKFSFWPWAITEDNQPLYLIFMFRDLFQLDLIAEDASDVSTNSESFDNETIMRFILTVKKNYRSVPYHNWSHGFSVCHSMYVLIKTCGHKYNYIESLSLFIGCICHDLDHRGKTNKYMIMSSSPLSALYSTSTMEHHHFNITVSILQREGHNIFKHLSSQNYKKVLGHLKYCILSTDLVKFFENKNKLDSHEKYFNPDAESHRIIHMAISMTFCDLCSMFKAWEMQLALVMIIMEEFWIQGDEEKRNGFVPIKMLDRDYNLELPDCQVGFIEDVCLPCFRLVGKLFVEASCTIDVAESNLVRWKQLASLPLKDKSLQINELQAFVKVFITENKLHFK